MFANILVIESQQKNLIYYELKHNIVEDTLSSFSYSIKNNFIYLL